MTQAEHHRERAPVGAPRRVAAPPPAVMTPPDRYVLRMVIFLAVVGVVAVALHEHAARFFMRNPALNVLILSVLAAGIVQSFRAVRSLEPAIAWVEGYRRGDPRVRAESGPSLLAPLAVVLREPGRLPSLSTTSVRSVLDGVDSRLDERRDTSRYLIALLIFLGLLGTFWGLLMTATSVGETIRGLNVTSSDPAQMFQTLRAGLEAPLSGMGTAFSTSLFGLAGSLVLGFLDLQASQAQNRFANDLETWLTGIAHVEGAAAGDGGGVASSYTTALLQQTAETLGDLERRMARVVDEDASLRAGLRALNEQLGSLVDELRTKGGLAELAADGQLETKAVLKRIASALEHQGGVDDAMRAHLKGLELGLARLIDDGERGRDRAVGELREEIRLLARTLSVIADRGR
jgi:hypothetical protein